MNYFKLFGIPVQLRVDAESLKPVFFSLSKKFHPDYFTGAGATEQEEALEQSALLNEAWKTFRDPDATIRYVLEEKGILIPGEKYELPPDFLMAVMEINETLMDAENGSKRELLSTIDTLQEDIYKPVKNIVEQYHDEKNTAQDLNAVKEYYYKKKYLDRIRKELLA